MVRSRSGLETVVGGYGFNVCFDGKEMDEKRKYKKENAETKNQFEKCTDLSAVEFIEKAFDSL